MLTHARIGGAVIGGHSCRTAAPLRRQLAAPGTRRLASIVRFKEPGREGEEQQPETAAEKARKDLEEALKGQRTDTTGTESAQPPPPASSVKEVFEAAARKPGLAMGEPKVSPWIAAFTRRRELWAGRLAMVGFTAACGWELLLPDHPNIMQQIATGLQLGGWGSATAATGAAVLGAIVLHDVITALAPWSPTFSKANLLDVAKRPSGPPTEFVSPLNLRKFFGFSELGAFSKANEIFHGRLAMIGFAAALLNQLRLGGYYGPGPLAQVAYFLDMDVNAWYAFAPLAFGAWALFWTTLAVAKGRVSPTGEYDIY